jgi:hypothetical protein
MGCLAADDDERPKLKLLLGHENVLGSGDIGPPFLTSALDGVEWSSLRPDRFTPPSPVSNEDKAGWGYYGQGKISYPLQGIEL